jgi:hypothetical protein
VAEERVPFLRFFLLVFSFHVSVLLFWQLSLFFVLNRKTLGMELEIVDIISASHLLESIFEHPFVNSLFVPILGGEHVTIESGTGLVHTAPGLLVCEKKKLI